MTIDIPARPHPDLAVADPDLAHAADAVVRSLELPTGTTGIEVHNPANGQVLASVPDAGPAAALEGVALADEAGREWAARTPRVRADTLRRWYDLLVEHGEQIALLITLEMGKPLAEARAEVTYGSDFVRWYAEEAVRPGGNVRDVPTGGGTLLTRRAPVGLSVVITPWNFPLAMATRKIAPALAAGCPVVIKPANLTPLTTYYAVSLAREAGVPEHLIKVVTTTDPAAFSEAVLGDPRVRKVSFTGSTGVGKVLLRLAADNVLRASMELGGNAPLIVFDDADLERAVNGAYAAKMRNNGQSCIAANRIYVQDGIAEAFIEGLTEKMSAVVAGDGLADNVALGPLIDDRAVSTMERLVENAVAHGAAVLTGGRAIAGPGHFFPADGDRPRAARTRRSRTRRYSAPSRRSSASAPRTRWCSGPTRPSSGSRAMCSPRASTEPSTSPTPSRPAWSASTRGFPPTRLHRSVGSSSPVSAVREVPKASRSTRKSGSTTSPDATPPRSARGEHGPPEEIVAMDAVDEKIVAELTRNARVSYAELAHRVVLSRNAVRQRIERLERQGHIAGCTIVRAGERHRRCGLGARTCVLTGPYARRRCHGRTETHLRGRYLRDPQR